MRPLAAVSLIGRKSPTFRSIEGERAGLADRAHDCVVVVRPAADDAVVEVDVVGPRWVLRGEGGRDRPGRLLRRCRRVACGHTGPAGGRDRRRRDLVGHAEEGRAGLLDRIRRANEHAAVREEVREVDGRPGDVRRGAADPVDLCHLLARPLGRVGDRVGLQHAGRRERRAIRECVSGAEEGVVRGAVLGRVGAGGHRVPADAGVGREGLDHPVLSGDSVFHQVLVGGHEAGLRVTLHQVGSHAVRGEHHDAVDGSAVLLGNCRTSRHREDESGRAYERRREPAGPAFHVQAPLPG